jgi:hypothetical protein
LLVGLDRAAAIDICSSWCVAVGYRAVDFDYDFVLVVLAVALDFLLVRYDCYFEMMDCSAVDCFVCWSSCFLLSLVWS